MSKTKSRRTELIRRKRLYKYLNQCTSEQVKFFKSIFPKKVPTEKLKSAIDLCKRTLVKNFKDGIRPLHNPKGGTEWLAEEL